jgi:hypothetical protein
MRATFDKMIYGSPWTELITPKYWDAKFQAPVGKKYKISVVTTCMDRLDDLKLTLPQNVEDNLNYRKFEFLVLDYNSTRDDIGGWIKSRMPEYLEKGIVTYYRTDEPKQYSMAHSRNICFKLATGFLVNNVDADNFINPGFFDYLNRLAHQQPEKAIFAKGKRSLHGRLGFYKHEFINLLGGYDEGLTGYGAEDHDLMQRAWALGFKLMWYGGQFYKGTPNHKKHQVENFDEKDWKYTESRNKVISLFNLTYGRFKANQKKEWGKALVVKNFNEEIQV